MGATKQHLKSSSSDFTDGFQRADDPPIVEDETKEEQVSSQKQQGDVLSQKSIQKTRQEKISGKVRLLAVFEKILVLLSFRPRLLAGHQLVEIHP